MVGGRFMEDIEVAFIIIKHPSLKTSLFSFDAVLCMEAGGSVLDQGEDIANLLSSSATQRKHKSVMSVF